MMASMVFFMLETRQDLGVIYSLQTLTKAQIGTARLCVYVLHKFSENRDFCVALNEPYSVSYLGPLIRLLPSLSNGTWADALFLSFYTFIITTQKSPLHQLQENLMIILTNVSPFVKSLHSTTTNKLMSLFNGFASVNFLFSKEVHHKSLFYLLETFNNLIQHQPAGIIIPTTN